MEVSDGDSKSKRGIAWSGYDHQESEWLVYWHGSGIHPSGDDGDYRAGSCGLGGNDSGGLATDIWRRSAFGRGVQRRRSGARNLAGADRNFVHFGRSLLFDAPVAGAGDADAALGGDYPDGRGVRSHRVFPDARRRGLGLATGECADHPAAWGTDLVPLAVEFGVGDRDAGRREPADDRNFAADVWSYRPETGKPRGGLENALTTTVLIHLSINQAMGPLLGGEP